MDDNEFDDVPDFDSLLSSAEPQGAQSTPSAPAKPAIQPNKVQQPKPQVIPNRSARSAILVSSRQKGNPILNHVRLLPWEYADIPADYVLGATTCALFLSLKYHRLHPEYVYSRIKLLGAKYTLRILLIMVDVPNHEDSLKELSKTSIVNNLTLILCWSAAEAGHYLELFKSSENAPPTAIRSQQAQSYRDSLVEFITTPRSINKSDAASLISTFGSLQAAINAQPDQISSVPGWGEKKVKQWTDAVKEDFRTRDAARRKTNAARNITVEKAKAQGRTADEEYLDGLFTEAMEQERLNTISSAAGRDTSKAFNTANSNQENERESLGAELGSQGLGDRKQGLDDRNAGIMAALAKLRKEEG
ncbi:mating-type switching protein swi10 [Uncinocarpus reesii 1704]|uniref:Mating-type switching protein swi10 n=1 Tax=Uncinocarpus reesii (strain UAMH 1704) TaxID=336963 RepID=C4JT23_UNCRE|nr:mating-type switching protein swi10 [Uncinocarpus reesii 1704]EEP80770.1 mating-type switching protein swi10 [Uncinocarpus reesii 1704]